MEWFILVMANIIIASLRDIYNKKILKKMKPVDYEFGYILSTNIIFGLLGFTLGWFSEISITPLLIINSIITAAALIFYFKAMKIDDVSKISSLQHINLIFVVIFAILFLKESVSWSTMLGIFLIIVGIYFLYMKGKDIFGPIREIHKSHSFKIMLLYSFLISINIILGKILVYSMEPKTYFFVFFNFSFLFFLLYLIVGKYNLKKIARDCLDKKKDMIVIGTLTSLENLTYYTALSMILVSYISPVVRLSSVLTVILASIFMKEKYTKYRLIGALITFLGGFIILNSI